MKRYRAVSIRGAVAHKFTRSGMVTILEDADDIDTPRPAPPGGYYDENTVQQLHAAIEVLDSIPERGMSAALEQAQAEERERCVTALEARANDLLNESEHYDAKITREAAAIIREMK